MNSASVSIRTYRIVVTYGQCEAMKLVKLSITIESIQMF